MKIPSLTSLVAAVILSMILALPADAQAPAKPAAPAKPKWQKVLPQTPPGCTLVTKDVAVYPEHTVTLTLSVPDKPRPEVERWMLDVPSLTTLAENVQRPAGA